MTLALIFSMFLTVISAPPNGSAVVFEAEEINYYEPLIRAVVTVESKGDIFAFNFLEQACGPFQIRPVRINDFNRRTGSNYKADDCFDYELSRKIFLYYCQGRNYEVCAKSWNGSGPMVKDYWRKVKREL